ncbi:hypothetical protein WJX84_009162 [Apatococcus fuscideae]|uniref:Methyltransferase-domain-containing protein n=1 Tax=Apatococcus fuscideae TaxID=2026836 RepID=A0AAW1SNT0_9CHLO
MQSDALVSTDVHWSQSRGCSGELTFLIPDAHLPSKASEVGRDSDGDLVVDRRDGRRAILRLEVPKASTPLQTVGLQVWAGALLLADFLLAHPELFSGHIALELGSGTGLAGLCLARVAKLTFLTDAEPSVLQQLQANVTLNASLFRYRDAVRVRCLDWFQGVPSKEQDANPHGWGPEDLAALQQVEVLLAADVIYDDDLTAAFLHCACAILAQAARACSLYLTIEKRFNLGFGDQEPRAQMYDDFMARVKHGCHTADHNLRGRLIDITSLPQHFTVERSKHVELWHFELVTAGG